MKTNLNSNGETSLHHPEYRPDVDGLRALAVFAVILFHAFPDFISGGYVGVDIFFVISGFLISTIILGSLERGSFSFRDFYARRVKRIFPSLIIVLLSCFIIGWFVLLRIEYLQLFGHMIGGAGFISNLVLWFESGYFEGASELKPLLHLWSLGIEEQFYIFWPLIAFIIWRIKINFFIPILLMIVLSLSLGTIFMDVGSGTGFYSPFCRFWELLIGALLAHLHLHPEKTIFANILKLRANLVIANVFSLVGFALIIIAFLCLDRFSHFPGWLALLPTMGAALIIFAGNKAFFNRLVLSNKAVVWTGLISYPLYLWHWPLFSFANIIEGNPSIELRLLLILLTFILSISTYYLIERPIRSGKLFKKPVLILSLSMVGIVILAAVGFLSNGFTGRAIVKLEQPIHEVGDKMQFKVWQDYAYKRCDSQDNFDPKILPHCFKYNVENSDKTILIWGDSHAGSWIWVFYEIAKQNNLGIYLISHVGCPPLLDVKRTDVAIHTLTCDGLGKAGFETVQKLRPDKVVLIASWSSYSEGFYKHGKLQRNTFFITDDPYVEATKATSRKALKTKLTETIAAIQNLNIPILIFKSTPSLKEWIVSGYVRHRDSFERTTEEYREMAKYSSGIIDILADKYQMAVFDPARYLCDKKCNALYKGKAFYSDDNHISAHGSLLFIDEISEILLKDISLKSREFINK